MAISVVQSQVAGTQASSTFSLTFGSNVTAGNSVLLGVITFKNSNVTITAATPKFGGSTVTGASKLAEVQSAFTASLTAYTSIWLLPNLAGGSANVTIITTNSTLGNSQTGLVAWEAAGLGSTPVLDKSSTGSGAGGTPTSGTTGSTTVAAELVVATLIGLDGLTGTPTSPSGYTNQKIGTGNSATVAGYQVQSSSGSTYVYANAMQSPDTNVYAGAVVTVAAALTAPAPVLPLISQRSGLY